MPKSTELKRLPADVAAESHTTSAHAVSHTTTNVNSAPKPKQRSRRKNAVDEDEDSAKRRCVSTACIACRKRKSKCDGNTPACAACSQVYGTECIYDPNSDHRRKGVYKNDIDNLKTRNSTLQTLIQALLNWPEEDVPELVRDIRTCESLDDVAEKIVASDRGIAAAEEEEDEDDEVGIPNGVVSGQAPTFESQLYGKMGDLRLDDGSVRYIGGTSNLIHVGEDDDPMPNPDEYLQQEDPITSWTSVTDDPELVLHLVNMYFTWHYTFFTTLSKSLFWRDFSLGRPPANTIRKTHYCTPLLVNAILALGCHFTSNPGARSNPDDSATAGDHFFREAKRLIMANDEHEKPRLTTVQALALMSVREAGCGREAKGWVYSGMSFRMALDMGLNLETGKLTSNKHVNGDEAEEDVRRVTFWGCFLFDKCWSNYLGRLPQLPKGLVTCPKPEVFPDEDAANWLPYTDSGFSQAHSQPSRTRAVAGQISKLCEISNDLMGYFYNPSDMDKAKGKSAELKKLSEIHTRLESWRRELPRELEPKEGGLSSVLVMHMFFQLLFIHLFRPFLKYTAATSPLPSTVSPRKLCTQAASMISKLLRLYKRSHGLRQICNVAVYIAHSACTIHLLNLPDKLAKRDVTHGVKHLEEIAEGWLCARRTLGILSVLAKKWRVDLPEEAAAVLSRTDAKFGAFKGDVSSPPSEQPQVPGARRGSQPFLSAAAQQNWPNVSSGMPFSQAGAYFPSTSTTTAGPAQAAYATSTSSAANRPPSSTYTLPPNDSATLRASAHPPAVPTPQNPNLRRQANLSADFPVTTGASPSDMFGGVEQLLRDSQDWAYRDQANLGVGFGNWGGAGGGIGQDGGTGWMEGAQQQQQQLAVNGSGASAAGMYGLVSSAAATGGIPYASMGANGWMDGVSAGGSMGLAGQIVDGAGMGGYNDALMGYNEDEWYQ